MTGKHQLQQAVGTDFKKAVAICLDEALTALEEAIHGLSDEQVWRRPFADRYTIGTLLLHLLENLDTYTCKFQTGQAALDHEQRFDIWQLPEGARPEDQGNLPSIGEMTKRLQTLRAAAEAALASADQQALSGSRHAASSWVEQGRNAADAYMRTVFHTMTHIRQIWLMRGAMGLTDKDGYPAQHWA